MPLRVLPLIASRWPAFQDLLQSGGACSHCWCSYWRIGSRYRHRAAAENRAAFRRIVRGGPPPGLLAFDGDVAVGWCQLTPRADLPRLERDGVLGPVDDSPVWCLSCFYVRKGHRQRGVATALIRGAISAARAALVPALEAYPLDRAVSTSSTFTGYLSTFAALGFTEVERRAPARPIVRYVFSRAAGSRTRAGGASTMPRSSRS